ncbi:MAG: Type 1 glutamine amidotransferase-like domain-containing protein [Candidatus Bathyarchaeota archaeon]|nr:Type 1 glutamine amidotransferase-like domain-containing protein [Candidatus Bathyarchaeota archaeon]
MPKLYLLGGENVFRRSARDVNQIAFQNAKHPLNVLVIPWARASFDRRYRKRKRLSDYFISLGACTVNFIEYLDSAETVAQKMTHSSIVYLTGGIPSVLIERLRYAGIDCLLKNYEGTIIGRSAGALALCKKCLTTCRSNSKVRTVNGIGLVDIALKAHYKPQQNKMLEEYSLQEAIYAVPEGSAIVYDHDNISFINNVYFFCKGKRQILKSI